MRRPTNTGKILGRVTGKIAGTTKLLILTGIASLLAACGNSSVPGSFDETNGVTYMRLSELMALNKLTGRSSPDKAAEKLECPNIIVIDGTTAHRVYNGPESNDTLKYQYSLGDIARDCALQGNELAMRVGIEGHVLLGSAGTPGSFSVPIRVAIVREADNTPAISKLYNASVTIPPGQTEGRFAIVTEPLLAPFIQNQTEKDYEIKVGIDAGGAKPEPAAHSHKRPKPS
jgi:hypothetical protein